MAVNESDSGPINETTMRKDFGASELERIGRSYSSATAQEKELMRRFNENISARSKHDSDYESQLAKGFSSDKARATWEEAQKRRLERLSKDSLSIMARIDNNTEAKVERTNRQALNAVQRAFSDSNVNGAVTSAMQSEQTQLQGMGLSGQSWASLVAQKEKIWTSISSHREQAMKYASQYVGRDGPDYEAEAMLKDSMQSMQGFVGQLAPISMAMKHLRARGEDPESQELHLTNMGDKAEKLLRFRGLQTDIRNGAGLGALSASDLQKRETEAATRLVEALKELRSATGKTKEELEALNKTAKSAAEEMEEIAEVKAAGGGNGSNGWQTGQAYATAISNAANSLGNTVQNIGVNIPMTQMANIGGFAHLENQKYDMWTAAVGGDMTARLNLASWRTAANFGGRIGSNMMVAQGFRGVGQAAGTVASGLQLGEKLSTGLIGEGVGGNVVDGVAQGIGGVLDNAGATATTLVDMAGRVSSSQANIAAQGISLNTTRQLNHIPGRQLQQWRDYMMGLRGAALNLGTGANAFMNEAGGPGMISSAMSLGLGPEEMGQLSGYGAENMGSMFNTSTVLESKRMENRGLGSAGTNMRIAAALSAGGSQNPTTSLTSMMESAVAKGFAGSTKALVEIADNTGQLVKGTAMSTGNDTTDALRKLIFSGLDGSATNKELAVQKEFANYSAAEGWRNNVGTSFSGMMNVDRYRRMGLNPFQSILMGKMGGDELHRLMSLSKGDATGELARMGIDVTNNSQFNADPSKWLKDVAGIKIRSEAEAGGTGIANESMEGYDKLMSWAQASPANREALLKMDRSKIPTDLWSTAIAQRGTMTYQGRDATQGMRDRMAYLNPNDDRSALPSAGAAFAGIQGDYNLGNQQRMGMVDFVMKNWHLNNGTDVAQALFGTGKAAMESPGADPEKRWATSAADAAKTFGESAMKLDTASGKLVEAADKLAMVAGMFDLTTLPNNNNQVKTPEQRLQEVVHTYRALGAHP